jgi:hypothetical protein
MPFSVQCKVGWLSIDITHLLATTGHPKTLMCEMLGLCPQNHSNVHEISPQNFIDYELEGYKTAWQHTLSHGNGIFLVNS